MKLPHCIERDKVVHSIIKKDRRKSACSHQNLQTKRQKDGPPKGMRETGAVSLIRAALPVFFRPSLGIELGLFGFVDEAESWLRSAIYH